MKHNIYRYLLTLVALFAMTAGAWADQSTYYVVGNFTNWETSDANKMTWDDTANEYTLTLDVPAGAMFKVVGIYNQTQNWYPDGGGNAYGENGELPGAGKYTVHFDPNGGVEGWFAGYFKVDIVPGSVIINDNQTEATFEMPGNDVTVSYELVRDMSVQMQAQVGDDPAKEPRYRVHKTGESWFPADMNYEQVMALFSVNDLIEKQALGMQNYFVNIYAVDAEGQPTGNAMDFQTFTFAPGRYCVTATGLLGGAYDGTTAPSNIFELFQGYQVTVDAGEYATFYKDENLYTEDEDAELYTISSVSDTEAVLSDKLAMVAANTPMLVYNKGTEAKTFILLPTEQSADEVEVAKEFRGTLEEKQMPASSATRDFYVCTGKAFEWVRDAGTIAANRCWLQIGEQVAAARAMTRSIVGGGNTTNMDDVRWQMEDGNYYDLQGRKVEKPNRKGIYIHNGRKVVVH
jgi:hypothetical protein